MIRCSLFLFVLFASFAQADSEFYLSPIVKSGQLDPSVDSLESPFRDRIVPGQKGELKGISSSGSISHSIQNQLPLPVSSYGASPGGLSQIRGLGTSAQDVGVQAFGISLNPGAGGGYDFSAFPQYLWSNYTFQMGPPLNATNPSSVAGTLTLVSWTQDALTLPGSGGEAGAFYSTAGVNQFWASGRYEQRIATIAGWSDQKMKGPAGGLSAQWQAKDLNVSFHVLATDLDVDSPGSTDFPTPGARVEKMRVLPVLQSEYHFNKLGSLKTSLFYDRSRFVMKTKGETQYSEDSAQWGAENVWRMKPWTLGVSFRRVEHWTEYKESPSQNIATFQVLRDIHISEWTVQPSAQGLWVSDFGLMPTGSIGVRRKVGGGWGFSRISYSVKVPTLMDLYSMPNDFQFHGNENLRTESNWTGILGWETHQKDFDLTFQGFSQLRKDARVLMTDTTVNFGNAYVLAFMANSKISPASWLDLTQGVTFGASRLEATDQPFPYFPSFLAVFGGSVHSPGDIYKWELFSNIRLSSVRTYHPERSFVLPAYAVLDLGFFYRLADQIRLGARVENLFDRSIEVVKGYPIGRSLSVMLAGQI